MSLLVKTCLSWSQLTPHLPCDHAWMGSNRGPAARWADPTELTGAALLTDPVAGYLTGAVLPVGGGWTAH
jgi:NAD(P)-dependent dehydrogenase (short-subunit alcohol dehydrogenase family)